MKSGRIALRPHTPMLRKDNARSGFVEAEQLEAVSGHLPAEIQSIIRFASVTGWRIASEVLLLEWRQVDFAGGEVRLEPRCLC
jgi:integrase